MKEVYTTRGKNQYRICLKTYRQLLQCSFDGTCTPEQSKKWKTLDHECGDLVQKLEKKVAELEKLLKKGATKTTARKTTAKKTAAKKAASKTTAKKDKKDSSK